MLKLINRSFVSRRIATEMHAHNATASVIYDLLCVKSHQAELSVLGAAVQTLILLLNRCVCHSRILCSFVLFSFPCIFLCTLVQFHHK